MTADEILDNVINGIDEGLIACSRYPNADTPNKGVEFILTHIKTGVLLAQREIHKGNVK